MFLAAGIFLVCMVFSVRSLTIERFLSGDVSDETTHCTGGLTWIANQDRSHSLTCFRYMYTQGCNLTFSGETGAEVGFVPESGGETTLTVMSPATSYPYLSTSICQEGYKAAMGMILVQDYPGNINEKVWRVDPPQVSFLINNITFNALDGGQKINLTFHESFAGIFIKIFVRCVNKDNEEDDVHADKMCVFVKHEGKLKFPITRKVFVKEPSHASTTLEPSKSSLELQTSRSSSTLVQISPLFHTMASSGSSSVATLQITPPLKIPPTILTPTKTVFTGASSNSQTATIPQLTPKGSEFLSKPTNSFHVQLISSSIKAHTTRVSTTLSGNNTGGVVPPPPSPPLPISDDRGYDLAIIVGCCVAALILIWLIIVVIVCCCRKRNARRQREIQTAATNEEYPDPFQHYNPNDKNEPNINRTQSTSTFYGELKQPLDRYTVFISPRGVQTVHTSNPDGSLNRGFDSEDS